MMKRVTLGIGLWMAALGQPVVVAACPAAGESALAWPQPVAESVARMDFAARFMHEIGEKDDGLEYITVGPEMMERIEDYLAETKSDDDDEAAVIAHVRSVRLVKAASGGKDYHEKALSLLRKNTHRYKCAAANTAANDSCSIQLWTRRRSGVIVELVVLTLSPDNRFELIDLTGEMDEKILRSLTKIPL